MQRKTKGGLLGVAAFAVLAVIGEIGDTDGDDGPVDAEVTAASDAATAAGTPGTADRSPRPTRTPEPSQRSTPSATASALAEPPPPEPESDAAAPADDPDMWTVVHVVDGDTVDVTRGGAEETVRIVGIDTPERGECGYDQATVALGDLIGGMEVELTGPGDEDRDAYGRLLRYVDRGEVDAGYEQISAGMAIARYDSRDGYGWHPREDRYIAADEATGPGYACAAQEPEPELEPEQEPAPAPAGGAEPWNQPGPDLDCADIGQRVRITGEDYHRLDADGDGWACESYG